MQPENNKKHILSKSSYLRGLQCPKSLWLYKHEYKKRDVLPEHQQAILQQGTNIGKLAQNLFPNGIDASPTAPYLYPVSVRDTANYIRNNVSTIYEAAFQFNQTLVAADILVQQHGKWYVFEVKSATSVKEEHILDAALQYYVITSSGLPIEDFSLVHINKAYTKNGPLDIHAFFSLHSVKDRILPLLPFISSTVPELLQTATSKNMPDVKIGKQCFAPYTCDFFGYCWSGLPNDSVFNLRGRGAMTIAAHLFEQGIKNFSDIPAETELDQEQYAQIEAQATGQAVIDVSELRQFMESVRHPLYFISVGTYQTAVPEFDGCKPYQPMPYRMSVLMINAEGATTNFTFLADNFCDPRIRFVEALQQYIGETGSLLTDNAVRLQPLWEELAIGFPNYTEFLNSLSGRTKNIMLPFVNGWYCLPSLKDVSSPTAVLKAFLKDTTRIQLPFANDETCSLIFSNLNHSTASDDSTRQAIIQYSSQKCDLLWLLWNELKQITVLNEGRG
jgi:Domain of unknown function(DUF2779)